MDDYAFVGLDYARIRLRSKRNTGRLWAACSHARFWKPTGGFWFNFDGQTCTDLNVGIDGTVTLTVGTVDVGGSRAALVAAEELGIPYAQVQTVVTDTGSLGYNDMTDGSRGTFSSSTATISASRCAISVMREQAARMWDIPVDPENGPTKVLRYTVVQDVGKAVHPTYVEGQYQGGAAQGIWWALNEEYVYGEDGRLQNPGFLDYRVPVCSDLSMIDTQILKIPNPKHPYGVRGVGETSMG